jgi:6,7-dimethyl-8-ribityllumazine synthase
MKILAVSSSFYGFFEKALVQNAFFSPVNTENDIKIDNLFEQKFTKNINHSKHEISLAITKGALEIPQTLSWCLEKNYDGIIIFGCVIKGKTTHFEHVCNEAMSRISQILLQTNIPHTNCIITANTEGDAHERCVANGKNLGKKGFESLLHMIDLKNQITNS